MLQQCLSMWSLMQRNCSIHDSRWLYLKFLYLKQSYFSDHVSTEELDQGASQPINEIGPGKLIVNDFNHRSMCSPIDFIWPSPSYVCMESFLFCNMFKCVWALCMQCFVSLSHCSRKLLYLVVVLLMEDDEFCWIYCVGISIMCELNKYP